MWSGEAALDSTHRFRFASSWCSWVFSPLIRIIVLQRARTARQVSAPQQLESTDGPVYCVRTAFCVSAPSTLGRRQQRAQAWHCPPAAHTNSGGRPGNRRLSEILPLASRSNSHQCGVVPPSPHHQQKEKEKAGCRWAPPLTSQNRVRRPSASSRWFRTACSCGDRGGPTIGHGQPRRQPNLWPRNRGTGRRIIVTAGFRHIIM